MPPDPSPDPASRVQALLAEFLARGEAGEQAEFDVFCRDHVEDADALRKLRDEWDRMQAIAQLVGEKTGSFAARLKQKSGDNVDPAVSCDAGPAESPRSATDELVRRLSQHAPTRSRYKLEGEVARGGMGAILKVWDEDLRRHLAMKVVLGKGEPTSTGRTPPVDQKQLARFLEEAQVTGQLDHPGIVPVHELGLDSDGRVYFTMKLVKGRDLKRIFDLVFEGKEGWNETRAVGVILKVCEAMAYAHAKGVIHRDLKPANVMVGSFGEAFVMDWGLARVVGKKDAHDIRIKPEFASSIKSVKTERRDEREEAPDSPIITMDGDVMGTPAYMPPEQARGQVEMLSARSDVYAIGAMLYHLVSRQMPYVSPGERITNRTTLARVLDGPPRPLTTVRANAPAELVAICEKAMSRDAALRYADTVEMASDLQAYLEGRVVRAHRTGALIEFWKWTKRNRTAAVSIGSLVTVTIGALIGITALQARANRGLERENYVANIVAAQASLSANEIAEAKRRLDVCPEDQRGWEWRHLKLASDTSSAVLRGHEKPVCSVAFSPDGTRIASGSFDNTTRVWDARSGELIHVLRGHEQAVMSVAFSPDGKSLASGSFDKTVRLWDARNGQLLKVFRGPKEGVNSVVFNPDGSRIAAGSTGGTINIWETASDAPPSVLEDEDDGLMSISFSPNGALIASAPSSGGVRIWDLSSGKVTNQLPVVRPFVTWTAAFSPDGAQVISGCSDGSIQRWDARTWDAMPSLHGHGIGVRSVVFSADGVLMASASEDQTIRVWNAKTGEAMLVLRGHDGIVTSVAFSPDGRRLASVSYDKTIRVWDIDEVDPWSFIPGSSKAGRSVTFAPDGEHIIAAHTGMIQIYDARTLEGDRVFTDVSGVGRCVVPSPDGLRLASAMIDKSIHLWDTRTGKTLRVFQGHEDEVWCVAFSPDAMRIASGSSDKTVRESDAETGQLIHELRGHRGTVNSVAYRPDGFQLVSASSDGEIRAWDPRDGKVQFAIPSNGRSIESLSYSPRRGRGRFAAASQDGTVRVWDGETGECMALMQGHASAVRSVAFSPDGTRIASGGMDKTVRLWDSTSGEQLLVLRSQGVGVGSVAFSPDGSRIVAASDGEAFRVWETRPDELHNSMRATVRRAQTLFDSLHDDLLLVEDVVTNLQADSHLPDDVRQAAVRIAHSSSDDSWRLNEASWKLVRLPGQGSVEYSKAVRWALAACRVDHDDGYLLNTLGVAYYRSGEHEKAIAALRRSAEKIGERPSTLAFLAMAQQRLGESQEAASTLARLRAAMKKTALAGDEESRTFMAEAEATIEGTSPLPR